MSKIPHVGVVDVDVAARDDPDPVQPRCDGEQAGEHARQREVGPQLFLGDVEPLALQLLGVVGHVPGLEPPAGEGLELLVFTLGRGAAQASELSQELEDFVRIPRHLGGERVLGEVREPGQVRGLVPQREDLGHQRCVVPLAGVRPLVRGARHPGLVELAPQRLVVACVSTAW